MKTKLLLLFVAACMTATSVFAVDYTWTGAASTDYATAGNWNPTRTTPATSDNLIIDGASAGASVSIYGIPSTQTINSLTVRNNCSVKLMYNALDNNSSARTLTVNATSNALNIDANSTLDLGNNTIQIGYTSAGFYQKTVNAPTQGLYVANMPDGTIANFSKIAAGQIAVCPGVFTKGVTVTAVNSGTNDVTFSDKFLVDYKSANITFFTTDVCTGTGILRSRAQTSTNPAYYPFTVELYGTGIQTVNQGYYKNLKLTGNRANATITMNGNTIGYFFENLDISSLTNYTVTGSAATHNFVGSIAQTIPVPSTNGFGTIALDNSAGATLSTDTKIANLKLINSNKLTLSGYNLTIATAISFSSANAYIVTNGTGAVSYKWSTNMNATILPIGVSATSYDPVTITPGANSMTFIARVGTTLSGSAASGKAYNAKEWVITPSAAGTATVVMSPSSAIYRTDPIIGIYNGASYNDVTATLTGSADPYSYASPLSPNQITLAATANKLVTGGSDTATPNATTTVGLNGAKIYAADNQIVVAEAKDRNVTIYSLMGTVLYSKVADSDKIAFALNNGIYIVSVDNQKIKVIIK